MKECDELSRGQRKTSDEVEAQLTAQSAQLSEQSAELSRLRITHDEESRALRHQINVAVAADREAQAKIAELKMQLDVMAGERHTAIERLSMVEREHVLVVQNLNTATAELAEERCKHVEREEEMKLSADVALAELKRKHDDILKR